MNSDQNILGHVVFFTVHKVIVEYEKLCRSFDKVGLDAKKIIPLVRQSNTASRAFRYAKTSLAAKGSDETFKDEYRVKYIKTDDSGARIYSLLRINVDQQSTNAKGEQETLITVHQSGEITTTAPIDKAEELINAFKRAYGKITDLDIRTGIINFIQKDCAGFALRPSGGVYFVPLEKKDLLNKLSEALSEWAIIYITSVIKDIEGLRSMQAACNSALIADVEQFTQECEAFMARKARESTVTDRLEKLSEFISKAEFYKLAFSFKMNELDDKISMLKNSLESFLKANEANYSNKERRNELMQKKHAFAVKVAKRLYELPIDERESQIKKYAQEFIDDNNADKFFTVDEIAECINSKLSNFEKKTGTTFDLIQQYTQELVSLNKEDADKRFNEIIAEHPELESILTVVLTVKNKQ